MDIKGKQITVIGLGISGFEAARFLKKRGAEVFVTEGGSGEQAVDYASRLKKDGFEVETGKHSYDRILSSDFCVISPGIGPKTVIYQTLLKNKVRFVSEIELASWFFPGEIIAITGTNGKTTTTSLIAAILTHFGHHAIACGNIGNPFVAELDRMDAKSKAVIEVSSFQLETTETFRPKAALLLNITPDHFDWHGDMNAYIRAKAKIFRNQQGSDYAVLNARDEHTRDIVPGLKSRVLYFNETPEVENPNWDAVLKVAEIYDLPEEETLKFLRDFPGIEHRLEKVAAHEGVLYINDSKSTNPSSLEWALDRMKEPAILLCGGKNKGNDFAVLSGLVRKKVKSCFAFGECAREIAEAWQKIVPLTVCGNMREALDEAAKIAKHGDTVLLSPACASFDQFKNYKDRGEQFKKMVTGMAKGTGVGAR